MTATVEERICARRKPEPCGAAVPVGDPDRPGIRFYCSDDCAILAAAYRMGLPTTIKGAERRAGEAEATRRQRSETMRSRLPSLAAARQAKAAADPVAAQARAEHLEGRYGPVRAIRQIVEQREHSKKVELDPCGHVVALPVAAKGARCRRCLPKPGADSGAAAAERKAARAAVREAKETARAGSAKLSAAEMDERWGPLRSIVKTLHIKVGSKRVLLSCGHERTIPVKAKQGRCDVCKERRTERT